MKLGYCYIEISHFHILLKHFQQESIQFSYGLAHGKHKINGIKMLILDTH